MSDPINSQLGEITDQKIRSDYVIRSLSPEFAMEVCDLKLKPTTENHTMSSNEY